MYNYNTKKFKISKCVRNGDGYELLGGRTINSLERSGWGKESHN